MVSFLPAGGSTEAALLRTPFRRVAPTLEVTDASALCGRFLADTCTPVHLGKPPATEAPMNRLTVIPAALVLAAVVGLMLSACSDDAPRGRCVALNPGAGVSEVLSSDDDMTQQQCLNACAEDPTFVNCEWTPAISTQSPALPTQPELPEGAVVTPGQP